jgi:hypothetical protein
LNRAGFPPQIHARRVCACSFPLFQESALPVELVFSSASVRQILGLLPLSVVSGAGVGGQRRTSRTLSGSGMVPLWSGTIELRRGAAEVRSSATEVRSSVTEVRSSVTEVRSSVGEVRSSVGEIQGSVGEISGGMLGWGMRAGEWPRRSIYGV